MENIRREVAVVLANPADVSKVKPEVRKDRRCDFSPIQRTTGTREDAVHELDGPHVTRGGVSPVFLKAVGLHGSRELREAGHTQIAQSVR